MYKELIEYIVKRLVDKTDQVAISHKKHEGKIVLEITVDAHDRGRIIGKDGQTIRALRMFLHAIAQEGEEFQLVIAE